MELYSENAFKIRSYNNAYLTLRKLGDPVLEMEEKEIESIQGVGKAITGKILEIQEKGTFETLERYREKTPPGIRELLQLKGIGAKKIKQVWDELDITTPGELYYACNENRLIDLKGFGRKTQENLKNQLEFYFKNKDSFLYATLYPYINIISEALRQTFDNVKFGLTGDARRNNTILDSLVWLAGYESEIPDKQNVEGIVWMESEEDVIWVGEWDETIPFKIIWCPVDQYGIFQFAQTGPTELIEELKSEIPVNDASSEEELFQKAGLFVIPPELRDHPRAADWMLNGCDLELVELSHIKGMVHCHSTYSDGIHTLEEMAEHAKRLGYTYFTITDHSRAAFYANGLSQERVLEQWEHIDKLNRQWDDFRILKGIESDILNDGSLDYSDEILSGFDIVIASIHSNLRMDKEKATNRLIKAIENPYTHVLGHPTGRLLLSRPGYPIDHMKVIDACAENGVDIEINANPYRLDLDWSWIPYALEKGVMISVNPDAHSKDGMDDVKFGIYAARKGGLTRGACLNALDVSDFLTRLHTKP
jgi:DNA polymerase (family 10)